MTDKFKNKYRISSARLRTWDYRNNGFYFITICTKNRRHFFGEIRNKELYLNDWGMIAYNCWEEIPEHFHNVELGEYVIMPNHVHGIIIINNPDIIDEITKTHEKSDFVETRNVMFQFSKQQNKIRIQNEQKHFRFRNQGKNSVSAIVGSYKSAVTKLINRGNDANRNENRVQNIDMVRNRDNFIYRLRHLRDRAFPVSKNPMNPMNPPNPEKIKTINSNFGWQPRFYDHIIRSYEAYIRISNYIKNNPAKWKKDKFNN